MKSFLFFLFVLCILPLQAQVNASLFRKVAVEGTDVVAYFTEGRPVKGNSQHSVDYKGAKFLFSNAKHAELFRKNPEQYAPQFGGYCSYAMAEGEKYGISPDAWIIIDGKLYLNYDKSVHEEWLQDKANLIQKANEHWKKLERKR